MAPGAGSPEVPLPDVQESLNANNTAEALSRLNARLMSFTPDATNAPLGQHIVSAYEQIQKRVNVVEAGQTPQQRADLQKNFREFEERLVKKGLRNEYRVLAGRVIDSSLESAESFRKNAEQWAKENQETIKTVGLVAGGVAVAGAALYAVKKFFGSIVTWTTGIVATTAAAAYAPQIREFVSRILPNFTGSPLTPEQQAKKKEEENKKKLEEEGKKKLEEENKKKQEEQGKKKLEEEGKKKLDDESKKKEEENKKKQETEKKLKESSPSFANATALFNTLGNGPILTNLPPSVVVSGVRLDVRGNQLFANDRAISARYSVGPMGSWRPIDFTTVNRNGANFTLPNGTSTRNVSVATAASEFNGAINAFKTGQNTYLGGVPGVARIELRVA